MAETRFERVVSKWATVYLQKVVISFLLRKKSIYMNKGVVCVCVCVICNKDKEHMFPRHLTLLAHCNNLICFVIRVDGNIQRAGN